MQTVLSIIYSKYKLVKSIICLSILIICIFLITGCSAGQKSPGAIQELVRTGFAFNTTYTITLYEGGSEDLLDECVSKCAAYEKIFSRTLNGSELYNINEIEEAYMKVLRKKSTDKNVKIPEEDIKSFADPGNNMIFHLMEDGSIVFEISQVMYDILEKGLYYSKLSDGGFDITIQPVSSLWDFMAESPEVPEEQQLKEAVKLTGYKNMELKDGKLVLKIPGMGIELGAIAKGFIADKLKEYLEDNGVTSGTVNLGGNVLCIGSKPDGTPFRIGVQQPFADRNEVITAIKAEDVSVVSSGIYERYFVQDEKIYHHILNPADGYPYNNGLVAVTIVSKESVDGDALSTTCFAMGLENGMEFVESLEDVYAVFITEDGKLHYSKGFKEMEIGN